MVAQLAAYRLPHVYPWVDETYGRSVLYQGSH